MSSIIYCFERATLLPEHLPLAAPEPAACSLGHAPLAVSPLTSLLAYGSPVGRGQAWRAGPTCRLSGAGRQQGAGTACASSAPHPHALSPCWPSAPLPCLQVPTESALKQALSLPADWPLLSRDALQARPAAVVAGAGAPRGPASLSDKRMQPAC